MPTMTDTRPASQHLQGGRIRQLCYSLGEDGLTPADPEPVFPDHTALFGKYL